MVDSWERFCWISKTISVRSRILKPHVMDVRDMTMWSSIHQRSKISFQHSKASRNWLDSLTWTTWNLSHQHVDFYEPKWTYVRKIPAAVVPNIVSLLGSPYTHPCWWTRLYLLFFWLILPPLSRVRSMFAVPQPGCCQLHAYFCWKYLRSAWSAMYNPMCRFRLAGVNVRLKGLYSYIFLNNLRYCMGMYGV
jgi:hypothetical protein